MSEIAASNIQATEGAGTSRTKRDRAATEADFGDLFARFAQSTARGAAKNGSMSLQIGVTGTPASPGAGAQVLPAEQAGGAQGASALREERSGTRAQASERGSRTREDDPREHATRTEQRAERGDHATDGTRGEPGADGGRAPTQQSAGDGDTQEARAGNGADAQSAVAQGAGGAPVGGGAALAGARAGVSESTQVSGISAVGKAGAGGASNSNAGGLFAELQSQARRTGQASAAKQGARQPSRQRSSAFRSQLTQGLSAALRQGRGRVTLRLRPDSLGELEVRVQVKGSMVHARITPSTTEAHRLLEQNIDSLRQSFEARGLQPGRIEIQAPDAGKEAHSSGGHHPTGQEGQFGAGGEERRSPEESGGGRGAFVGGDPAARGLEVESSAAPEGYGSPGVVYSVADGAARILMVDALA